MNTNVLDFPVALTRKTKTPSMTGRGATLFMHVRRKTLIAHLANPQGLGLGKAGKVAKT